MEEIQRGTATSYEDAYTEGYSAKYNQWHNRENPYASGTPEYEGFEDGYLEAVIFNC